MVLACGRSVYSPVVSGDYVFVESADNAVYAVEKRTGDEVAVRGGGGAVEMTPALSKMDTLFVAIGYTVFALDSATGVEKWRRKAAATPEPGCWKG